MSAQPGGERGSATVLACFALAALVVITATLLHVGSAVSVRHRAQSAADLAALAAGVGLDRGGESACAAARVVAQRMHVEMIDCKVEAWDVEVTVNAPVLLSSLGIRDARAVARAGPAE
ncbi:Rv3654c family TadE-like protein [Rhodococcus tibetensis]|uniref:Flp pilus-assembly TadE/G-like family protein n=1 Tax=Rhodococcus tibetensis TaxID=2965064 RepID=A0ABT1QHC3_9NOCA|nr:Rv3654c family TadE-like protein [Rhodococcus sp. FXJ9.536]MCQ4121689.1 flp pilus-assembly TadE/G-like family protein [Rhodococcus sp. FXJ9.536]